MLIVEIPPTVDLQQTFPVAIHNPTIDPSSGSLKTYWMAGATVFPLSDQLLVVAPESGPVQAKSEPLLLELESEPFDPIIPMRFNGSMEGLIRGEAPAFTIHLDF